MSESDYPVRRDPKKVVVAIAVVIIIAIASYGILTYQRPTFTVYTYDSFMLWGDDPDTIDNIVFSPFEAQYGVDIKIERLSTDANGIVSRLVAEAENPVADVVIGIDNILILQAIAKSVLERFTPANLDLIEGSIINALDPEHYIVPFDFGLVTVIYRPSEINATSHPQIENMTFLGLSDLSSYLVTENPHFSSPGLAFLLGQIAVYDKLMEEDWTQWWSSVKGSIDVQEGWTEAWTKWDSDPTKHLLVSYGTDPAYDAYYTGGTPNTAIAPIHFEGSDYAWMQVEGIGLVKNGPNPSLAQSFIEYCLTPAVQGYISLNQWMFPANMDVDFDPAFDYALHPDDINLLNELFSSAEIASNLESWLDEYDAIMTG
ncbi:MAG: thiamine ABC transporter substrate-binding protein [Candidatus Thorarchaeota archaeon]